MRHLTVTLWTGLIAGSLLLSSCTAARTRAHTLPLDPPPELRPVIFEPLETGAVRIDYPSAQNLDWNITELTIAEAKMRATIEEHNRSLTK